MLHGGKQRAGPKTAGGGNTYPFLGVPALRPTAALYDIIISHNTIYID